MNEPERSRLSLSAKAEADRVIAGHRAPGCTDAVPVGWHRHEDDSLLVGRKLVSTSPIGRDDLYLIGDDDAGDTFAVCVVEDDAVNGALGLDRGRGERED